MDAPCPAGSPTCTVPPGMGCVPGALPATAATTAAAAAASPPASCTWLSLLLSLQEDRKG